jgi:hypothetical protein
MSMRDEDLPHDDPSARQPGRTGRFPLNRTTVATGAVGLAVLLGGGAYLIGSGRNGTTVTEDTGALSPVVPAVSPQQPATDPLPAASATSAVATTSPTSPVTSPPAKRSPSPAKKVDGEAIRKEIAAARAAAEKEGHPLQRALTEAPGVQAADVSQRTEDTKEGTIRVTSAKGDLSGQQEMLMAADDGHPVGDAQCTQNLRFSNAATARKIPTVLLCWRTSATRSVVTFAVAKKGKPSAASSVAVLDREWKKLG